MEGTKPDPIMTVQEVSEYLKLADSTVYKLAREGKLPGQKIGGTWRFSRDRIDEWLAKPMEKQVSMPKEGGSL